MNLGLKALYEKFEKQNIVIKLIITLIILGVSGTIIYLGAKGTKYAIKQIKTKKNGRKLEI